MREAISDGRLIDLLGVANDGHELALILADTQGETYARTGHVLALNDEFVWRRLKAAAGGMGYRKIGVRCIFCPAVAPLGWWIDTSMRRRPAFEPEYYQTLPSDIAQATSYLAPCDGPHCHERLVDTLSGLHAPLDDPFANPLLRENHP